MCISARAVCLNPHECVTGSWSNFLINWIIWVHFHVLFFWAHFFHCGGQLWCETFNGLAVQGLWHDSTRLQLKTQKEISKIKLLQWQPCGRKNQLKQGVFDESVFASNVHEFLWVSILWGGGWRARSTPMGHHTTPPGTKDQVEDTHKVRAFHCRFILHCVKEATFEDPSGWLMTD